MSRAYDSSRRQEQARLTRQHIIDVATELFVERGYAATSIGAIARGAGVAPQTVHAIFGTKAALLGEAVDVAMAGDHEPVAIFDREDARTVLDATDPGAAAAGFARAATALLARAGQLIAAADVGAHEDAQLDELRRAGHRARLADMRRVARAFDRAGLLRPGITPALAADLLWATASPDAFRACAVHRGWSPERFERWLAETVRRTLFEDESESR